MFRDRNGELSHLIERYETFGSVSNSEFSISDDLDLEKNLRRAEIESFSDEMILSMVQDKALDLEFTSLVYEFDQNFFIEVFKKAISMFYSQDGCEDCLRMIGQLKYFQQAIEGFESIYGKIKDSLSSHTKESYYLLKKLNEMMAMEEFDKLPEEHISLVKDMAENLKPFAKAPEPNKPNNSGNWAEHNLLYTLIENSFNEERAQFESLFRTET